ncbi:hypothetical protein Hdeb2414_s1051g00976611 [Helianthus debilis subsp. tardiflorus]
MSRVCCIGPSLLHWSEFAAMIRGCSHALGLLSGPEPCVTKGPSQWPCAVLLEVNYIILLPFVL